MAKKKVRPGDPAPRGTPHPYAAEVWKKDVEPHHIYAGAPARADAQMSASSENSSQADASFPDRPPPTMTRPPIGPRRTFPR